MHESKRFRKSWAKLVSQGRLDNTKDEKPRTLGQMKTVSRTAFLASTPLYTDNKARSSSEILVLHPESSFVFSWGILLIFLIVCQSFTVPYILCFGVQIQGAIGYFDFSTTVVFILDIGIGNSGLNFNTAFFKNGAFITNRREIAHHYIRLWYCRRRFWLDLVSSFPYNWLVGDVFEEAADNRNTSVSQWSSTSNVLRLIRVLRFMRVARLIRLAKLKRILIKIEDYIASATVANIFVFLRLLFLIFFLAHWTACCWYYLSMSDLMDNDQTWVGVALAAAQHSTFDLYVTSLYWTFSTMSTVGYGDVHPYTRNEMIFAICAMEVACVVFAYTIGSIGSLITKSSADEYEYRSRVISVNRYMKKKAIPSEAQFRVRRYLEYLWEHQKRNLLNEKGILELLSEPLRDEIYTYVHGSIVSSCPVFELFERQLVVKLSKLLEGETFAPGDIIIQQGEMSTKLYFVLRGAVQVFHKSTNSIFQTVGEKSFFGEIAFFTQSPRCASVKSFAFVDLFSMSRTDLVSLADKFPTSKEKLEFLVRKCSKGDLSSLFIRCYLCNELGHVAIRCSRVLLNLDHDISKRKWLDSKKTQTKYVNPYLEPTPNMERFHRKKAFGDYKARNVIGGVDTSDEIFNQKPDMLKLVRKFEHTSDLESPSSTVQSKAGATRSPGRPRFSIIVNQEDAYDPIPAEPPRKNSFRKSLLMRVPPIIEVSNCEGMDRAHSVDSLTARDGSSSEKRRRIDHAEAKEEKIGTKSIGEIQRDRFLLELHPVTTDFPPADLIVQEANFGKKDGEAYT